jgi:hypothetical protein
MGTSWGKTKIQHSHRPAKETKNLGLWVHAASLIGYRNIVAYLYYLSFLA